MKAIVYDSETGEIVRVIRGAVPIENQRVMSPKKLLTSEDIEIPESITGKIIDPDTLEVVDNPDYERIPSHGKLIEQQPVSRRNVSESTRNIVKSAYQDAKQAREDGDVEEALENYETIVVEFFEVLTGDHPDED